MLTYCLNIHPGESWSDNLATLRTTLLAVRDLVSPSKPFPLGLRLSAAAAATLNAPAPLEELRDFLNSENLHVITVNAFPYGRFHGAPVKENVYAPDWRSPLRRDYTNQVATLLAALIPEGATATISTVPCSWKPWINSPADLDPILDNLAASVAHCARIAGNNGRDILLTLEPEPGCLLETTPETIAFFKDHLFTRAASRLATNLRITEPAARNLIRHHLGVCLDTCHAALQFEDPAQSLRLYESQGIRVPKIQISSALRTDASPESLTALRLFDEPVYLHQVKARTPKGEILSWPDLPPALAALPHTAAEEVRVHFHVPLHFTNSGPLHSTASLLTPKFLTQIAANSQTHLEIETYTWHVLPKSLQSSSIEKSIAAEFAWFHQSIGTG